MRKLRVFNFMTLDGYYKDVNNDISWHNHGVEENDFSIESLKDGTVLLFGRVTYELMAGFWTSAEAFETFPEVAEGMNKSEKIVFSRTMKQADWMNTKVVSGDIVEEVRQLKSTGGSDLTILGSGTIVTLFAGHDLIDEYQLMIDPVAIGNGISIFSGIKNPLNLELTGTRTFKSGVVLMEYRSS